MLYRIQNELLTVTIDSLGAQLQSILGANGTEYLWQGDSRYWSDRAINIFPYVARLTKGQYTYRGKTYEMPIHGFGPTAEYAVAAQAKNAITFFIEDNDAFLAMYPFRFRFSLTYRVEGNALYVDTRVENRDEKTLYFGVGGHPGFNAPMEEGLDFGDYYLQFPPCQPRRVEFTPACFVTGEESPFHLPEGKLPLDHSMFDDDAIVLKGVPGTVTLRSDKGSRGVTMHAPGLPVFGFWHMPKTDAPYICLEPWSSLPSRQDIIEDLETQPDLIALEAGNQWNTTWWVECF